VAVQASSVAWPRIWVKSGPFDPFPRSTSSFQIRSNSRSLAIDEPIRAGLTRTPERRKCAITYAGHPPVISAPGEDDAPGSVLAGVIHLGLVAVTTVFGAVENPKLPANHPKVQPAPTAQAPDRSVVSDADRQFWSFQPLRPVEPPSVPSSAWCRTPIDAFVPAKLKGKGLSAQPVAERSKLIRRASLDLIGLPPSPKEIEAFVHDVSPHAYEDLIDRLLASPHYGERWGRHWLDHARFAESHGFEHDSDRPHAYHYRDFVIQALNEDLPYDRFVRWQLAGDELAPDNLLAWKATGFLAAGTHATQITANQAEKERYDELDDIARTIGASMLGLSIGCARCHDHKFDPIPSADYYRFLATFTKTVRSDYDVPADRPAYEREMERWNRDHAPLVAALDTFEKESLPSRLAAWEKSGARPTPPSWLVLDNLIPQSQGGATLTRQADGSFLATDKNPDFDTFTFTGPAPAEMIITAIKVEALADPSLVKNGPGRADNGNFALSDFKLTVTHAGSPQAVDAPFRNATATFEQKGLPVSAIIDGDKKSAWAVDPQFGTNQAAVLELGAPLTNSPGATLTFTLAFNNNQKHSMGRTRLSVTGSTAPTLDGDAGSDLVGEVLRVLEVPPARRNATEKETLLRWYRGQDPEWRRLEARVRAHLAARPKLETVKVLVCSEGVPALRLHTQGPDFYDQTFFLKRGDLAQKQGEAPPGFLQVLMRTPESEKHWQHGTPPGAHPNPQKRDPANWLIGLTGSIASLGFAW
jgi:Protein of unknown function (DUF1549)